MSDKIGDFEFEFSTEGLPCFRVPGDSERGWAMMAPATEAAWHAWRHQESQISALRSRLAESEARSNRLKAELSHYETDEEIQELLR